MTILLTNDDGIDAPGLAAMAEALAGLDDLLVSAPAANQSGVGMAISIEKHLRPKRHPDGPRGERRYSIDGTPADAVKYGLEHLLGGRPPRLVASGINFGPNLGRNVRCSGTVGAAFAALAVGVPALAVSVDYVTPPNWEGAKHYARLLAEKCLELAEEPGREPFLLNLNVPSLPPEEIPGLVTARHGNGGFLDNLAPHPDGQTYSLGGHWIETPPGDECDSAVFAAGFAVLTPLRLELTHDALLRELRERWKKDFLATTTPRRGDSPSGGKA